MSSESPGGRLRQHAQVHLPSAGRRRQEVQRLQVGPRPEAAEAETEESDSRGDLPDHEVLPLHQAEGKRL